jgi:hypothetical protein
VAIGLLLLAFTIQQIHKFPSYPDAPVDCDRFGYERQAALFRAHGLAGLDTRLETPNARRLIEAMRASGRPVASWFQAVAPHCHHYKPAVDRVVLQYPPGTGFLMLAFPVGVESRGLLMSGILGTAILFAALAGGSATLPGAVGALFAGLLVVAAGRSGHFSESVPPAILLAALAGALLNWASAARRAWPLALVGLVIGLSGEIRIANLALGFGPLAVLGWQLLTRRRAGDLARAAGFAAGMLAGGLPFLAANLINAGSVLATTYAPSDAAGPDFGLAALWRGLTFYLQPHTPAWLLLGALLLGGWGLWRRPRPGLGAAMLSMAISLAYLLPRPAMVSYYLTPAAAFLIAAAVSPPALAGFGRWRALTAAAIVALGGTLWALLQHYPGSDDAIDPAVRAALAADPIVWSDSLGGRFVLEGGAYAAKLQAAPADQDRLLAAAASAGIPQLMTQESDAMRAIAARLQGGAWTLTPLGTAFGTEIYRLAPRSG